MENVGLFLCTGCEIGAAIKTDGLESLAKKGVLYFNLHTKAHTYYGEMRGQLYPGK